MCKSIIEELSDAESLLEWLDREKWGSNPVEWIFRGQRMDSWCVSPSAWRPNERYLRDGQWQPAPTTSRDQCQAEYEMVRRFFKLGDVQGLPLPGDSPELRARLESENFETLCGKADWPPVELHWLIAIAQHYGIPTRFIDWTRKPLIAAWFAAEKAAEQWGKEAEVRKKHAKGRFVVWAINRNSDLLARAGWKLTSAPRAAVPNLHLQSGLFTYRLAKKASYSRGKDVKPLCDSIRKRAGRKKLDSTIRAASVDRSEAGRLLTLLRNNFVQATTVYAGYDGVAQSVIEPRWRRPLK